MESIHEKRQRIHKWVDQAEELEIEELLERTILEDDGGISEVWETELEKRRNDYKSGKAITYTLEELKAEIDQYN
jgi:hypothetical protein